MGFKPRRIGVVFALQAHSFALGEAFDVVGEGDERVDAGEELFERPGARRFVEGLRARLEAAASNLAGARSDRHAQGRLVVDEDGFEVEAGLRLACKKVEALVRAGVVGQQDDAITQRLDALAHGVQWEEVAQDDPEPFHAVNIIRLWGR